MSAIFLSHSSRDNETALRIKAWLESLGHRSVFLDFDPATGIPAGRNWEKELYQQLRACRAVIVLCSEHSMASRWCFAEITNARSLGKHIFPIKVDDCAVDSLLGDLQIVDLVADPEALTRLARSLEAAGVDAADPFDWDGNRPPYPGLLAFQESDAAIFAGRDKEIGVGLDLITQMRRYGGASLLLLLGASGCGKSSLMRAGLLPRLRRDRDHWRIIGPMRPGDDPVAGLAAALASALQESGQEAEWREIRARLSSAGPVVAGAQLADLVRELSLGSSERDASALLFVDQLEELLGHPVGHPSHRFLGMIRSATDALGTSLLVVATLRSDYLGTFQNHPEGRGLAHRNQSLGPLSVEGLTEVIEKPARLAGLELEPALVQVLLQDTEAEDALPLLAFTLRELWELVSRERSVLEVGDYRDRLGGLRGSVARAANGVLDSSPISIEEEEALRSSFMGMVRVDEEGHFARRAVGWSQLSERAHEWLERFVEARLLVSSGDRGDRTLEVAHEALFRAWDKLGAWLAENREALLFRRDLSHAAEQWGRGGRSDDDLWRGGRLMRAHELRARGFTVGEDGDDGAAHGDLPLAQEQLDFLAASELAEARDRRRKQLRRIAVLGVAVLVAMVSMALFLWALTERRAARVQASRLLAKQAYVMRDQLDLALLLSLEAARTQPTFEARSSLLSLLAAHPGLETILDRQGARVHRIAVSPEGDLLAAGGDAEVLRLVDLRSGKSRDLDRSHRIFALAFGPDGNSLLSAGTEDGNVHLWDPRATELRKTLRIDSCPSEAGALDGLHIVFAAAFDPQQRRLATAHANGFVRLWNEAAGVCVAAAMGHLGGAVALAFDPVEETLASGGADGQVQLWDISDGLESVSKIATEEDRIGALAFRPGSRLLAGAGAQGRAYLWDLTVTPSQDRGLESAPGTVLDLMFSADGALLAGGGSDGSVRLWDPDNGELRAPIQADSSLVGQVAFGPGRWLATAGDRTVRLWKDIADSRASFQMDSHGAEIRAVAFDPSGQAVASAGEDREVRLWNLEDGRLRPLPSPELGDTILALAYSPDGEVLAAADGIGTVRAWRADGGQRKLEQVRNEDRRPIWTLAFDSAGNRLAAGAAERRLFLWDLARDRPPVALALPEASGGGSNRVRSLAFDASGTRLAAGFGPSVLLWDLSPCEESPAACADVVPTMARAPDSGTEYLSLSFGPTGGDLFGGSAAGEIYRWQIEAAGGLQTPTLLPGHKSEVRVLALDTSGSYLASGGGGGTIRLWDSSTGEALFELMGHTAGVDALRFEEGHLLSGSLDGIVRRWRIDGFDDLGGLRAHVCRIANRNLTREEWSQFLGTSSSYDKTCPGGWTGMAPLEGG